MRSIFSPNSKLMQVFEHISDLIILNVIYLICCLPIVTIGAATTALYTVCFRMGTDRESQLCKSFFQAFKANWRQGTIIWIINLLFICYCFFCIFLFYRMDNGFHNLYILFIALTVLGVMVLSYVFPLLSQFENTTFQMLYNSFVFSLVHLFRSLLMAFLNIFPVLLIFLDPYLYLGIGLVWYIFYYSAVARCNVKLLQKVFAPFKAQEEPS